MSAHVVCISSNGGLPIFSRKKGNAENLPFPVIGSLNGVHMFGKPRDIELLGTETQDFKVAWKEYYDSVVLIGISSGCTLEVLQRFLDSVFSAIVVIVGIGEINSQRNIERLKRELKLCYPLIDRLLENLDSGEATSRHSSDLVGMSETIMCTENNMIQIILDAYTECVDSMYSCVLIHGKIAAATESWWSLHPDERKLLSYLATVENTLTSKDIPVFLPYKSPNTAFRFVACTLIPEVQVCCLCGPTPSLPEIEHSATQCFKSTVDLLGSALQCHPRNLPQSCQLDEAILGVLLLNIPSGKYVMSKNPQAGNKKTTSSSHRVDILRTFFYQTVRVFLMSRGEKEAGSDGEGVGVGGGDVGVDEGDENEKPEPELDSDVDLSAGKETYWCSEYHKCHALRSGGNILCLLFGSNVPIFAARQISVKTLKLIVSDKQVSW